MRTLIYQYWYGKDMENCAKYGKEVMSAYAKRIGAEYRFDRNPTFFDCICEQPISFSCLMPVFNPEFHKYDRPRCDRKHQEAQQISGTG